MVSSREIWRLRLRKFTCVFEKRVGEEAAAQAKFNAVKVFALL